MYIMISVVIGSTWQDAEKIARYLAICTEQSSATVDTW